MPSGRSAARTAFTLLAASIGVAASPRAVVAQQVARAPADGAVCADGNGGLTLPPGFCAIIFADSLAGPRHMAVGADGLLYVALRGQRGAQGAQARPGGVMVLRDADGDGRAEVRRTLVEGFAATEAAVRRRALYTENGTAILRWALASDGLSVVGAPDTIARDLPGGGHAAKTFAFDRAGR